MLAYFAVLTIVYLNSISILSFYTTIKINLLKENSVNYNLAVNKYLNKLFLLNVKSRAIAV
jgi:hypothetical protein